MTCCCNYKDGKMVKRCRPEILGVKADKGGSKRLKRRVERLRKGILKAADLCAIHLEGVEYRFLTPDDKPWYGMKDFK